MRLEIFLTCDLCNRKKNVRLKECTIKKFILYNYNYSTREDYGLGEQRRASISLPFLEDRNGSGKCETSTCASKFVQFVLAAALMECYLQMRKQTLLSITKRFSSCRHPDRLPGPCKITFVVAKPPSPFSVRYISP